MTYDVEIYVNEFGNHNGRFFIRGLVGLTKGGLQIEDHGAPVSLPCSHEVYRLLCRKPHTTRVSAIIIARDTSIPRSDQTEQTPTDTLNDVLNAARARRDQAVRNHDGSLWRQAHCEVGEIERVMEMMKAGKL